VVTAGPTVIDEDVDPTFQEYEEPPDAVNVVCEPKQTLGFNGLTVIVKGFTFTVTGTSAD
jgi:hypothetical protein